MTDRYQAMFDRLRGSGKGAFGAFIMLGDPGLNVSLALLETLATAGADMLEVGIPFSDPVADGPIIQAAAERALAAGVAPPDCFRLLKSFRERHPDIPVGILTYANLVEAPGRDAFYRAAAGAGVDSVLVADVPSLEAEPYVTAARAAGTAPVLIAAPNTPEATLARIAQLGAGYTYCVARTGVTGADRAMELDHAHLFATLARHDAPPPVLGFGISTPEHVREALAAGAAGVISGSAIVRLAQEGGLSQVGRFVAEMKAATRRSS
jgi:tryptophan synthase alpha chain